MLREKERRKTSPMKSIQFNHLLLSDNSPSCSAINRLPRTLAVWGESITKQTGWNITFLVGGPVPCQNGKIMYDTLTLVPIYVTN